MTKPLYTTYEGNYIFQINNDLIQVENYYPSYIESLPKDCEELKPVNVKKNKSLKKHLKCAKEFVDGGLAEQIFLQYYANINIDSFEAKIQINPNTFLTYSTKSDKNKLKINSIEGELESPNSKKELNDTDYFITQFKKDAKEKNIEININEIEENISEKLMLLDKCKVQIKKAFVELRKRYVEKKKAEEEAEKEEFLNERINPSYIPDIALKVEKQINNVGVYNYLKNIYSKLSRGSSKPIIRGFLASESVILGLSSFFLGVKGPSERGKSYLVKLAVLESIPEQYLYRLNRSSAPAFIRKASIHPKIFEKQIFIFGDLGDDKDLEFMLSIFNILKTLITEGRFDDEVCDNKNNPINLHLEAETICATYETVNPAIITDEQILTRSIDLTPDQEINKEDVIQFSYLGDDKDSKTGAIFQKGLDELKEFKEYQKYLVNKTNNVKIKILYFDLFMRLTLNSRGEPSQRKTKNEINMFHTFCLMELDKCLKLNNGWYIPRKRQLEDYLKHVAEFTGLTKGEQNLIKDIAKRVEPIEDSKIYSMIQDRDSSDDYPSYLMKNHGLENVSDEKRYFFTISSIRRHMSNLKSVKSIQPKETLYSIYKKGYFRKLDSKYNENFVYYLDPDAYNFIKDEVEVCDEDIQQCVDILKDEYDIDVSFDELNQ